MLCLMSFSAKADYVNFGGVSHHFNPERDYNETNYGFGYEYEWKDNVNLAAGWYKNSLDRDSYYAGIRYTPDRQSLLGARILGADVSYVIGGISGYRKYVVPMVLPSLCWENVCTFVVPKINKMNNVTVLGVNFRLKF